MEDIKRIGGFNLLVLVIYTVVFSFSDDLYLPLILLSIGVGMHTITLFIISLYHFIRREHALGRTFLLTMAVILVVGFSTCFGVMEIKS